MKNKMGVVIKAIEYYLPDRKVSNADLQAQFPEYDFAKFESKVGIKNRYWASIDETALDLATQACEKLFSRVDRSCIDYIIYCTQSPEYFLPTSACLLQERLNLRKDVGAYDFNLGCSGYVYGVSMAKALIQSEQCRHVLLVTAETYSKYLHHGDKSNRAIFGDGATATLLSAEEKDGVKKFSFGTDGSGAEKLIVKNGAGRYLADANACVKTYGSDNTYTDNHLYMNGPEIFNFTTAEIPAFTQQVVAKNNYQIDTVDYYVFHQANAFMLEFLRKQLKIDKKRFYIDLADGGNTVSNTIPIALKRLSKTFVDEKYCTVAVIGFGVGLSWAGGIIEINKSI